MRTAEDVKKGLRQQLGHEPYEWLWNKWEREGRIDELISDPHETAFEDFAFEFHEYETQMQPRTERNPVKEAEEVRRALPQPSAEYEVLSYIYALEAGSLDIVQEFRGRVLPNGLIPVEELRRWMHLQERDQDGPERWIRAALDYNGEPFIPEARDYEPLLPREMYPPELQPMQFPRHPESPFTSIEYREYDPFTPVEERDQLTYRDHQRNEVVDVAHRGVLDQIRWISEVLHERYAWDIERIPAFLVCGDIPPIHPVTVAYDEPIRAFERIVMTIDPAMTVKSVADAYRIARNQLAAVDPATRRSIKKRGPGMDGKHIALARMAAPRIMATDERAKTTWRELLDTWNKEFPDWAYKPAAIGNFIRDAHHAFRRIARKSM